MPSIANIFVLANPTNPNTKAMTGELAGVTRSLNMKGDVLLAGNDQEIQAAFKTLSQRPRRRVSTKPGAGQSTGFVILSCNIARSSYAAFISLLPRGNSSFTNSEAGMAGLKT